MKVVKIIVQFKYDTGDNFQMNLSDKVFPFSPDKPDALFKKSFKLVKDFSTNVKEELCTQQLELKGTDPGVPVDAKPVEAKVDGETVPPVTTPETPEDKPVDPSVSDAAPEVGPQPA